MPMPGRVKSAYWHCSVNSMLRLACKTLGCKLNQIETENIANFFVQAGSELVSWNDRADVYLINTCTVTSKAEQKARREIRLALFKNPQSIMLITGCYAELDADELDFGHRAIVIPGSKKNCIAELALELVTGVLDHNDLADVIHQYVKKGESVPFFFSSPHKLIHTRPFLKIQDGCSKRCTYCRVCIARGNPQSLDARLVLERVHQYEALGAPEVVLTGVNLSLYYSNGMNFESLLAFLINNTNAIKFRLSSWEPDRVTDAFLEIFSHPRVQPHLHLSIQSGSDAVLSRMNRPYTKTVVLEAVDRLRKARGRFFLGSDFISGFPGETDADFHESLSLIHELAVAGVHAFTFSPRPGTPAYTMKPKVPERIAVARTEALITAGNEERMNYIKQTMGVKKEIILENFDEGDYMTGITADYLRVYLPRTSRNAQVQVAEGLIKALSDSSLANLFDVEADLSET